MKKGVDFIGVGIGSIIINKEGKVFASLKGPKSRNERGKWEFPGGAVEFGETLEASVVREMKEEFGIEVEIMDTLGTINHILPEEKQHWVTMGFVCKIKKGVPKIKEPHKSEKIGWFSIEELTKMDMSVITKARVEALKRKYPKGCRNFSRHSRKCLRLPLSLRKF